MNIQPTYHTRYSNPITQTKTRPDIYKDQNPKISISLLSKHSHPSSSSHHQNSPNNKQTNTMSTEVAAAEIVDAQPSHEVVEPTKQAHKLERKWAFWFDTTKPKQGAAWGSTLKKAYTFDTVEEFWCLYDQIFKPSRLVGNADFHLFKAGVEPKWEDPECANGGKWTVSASRKTNLDGMWLETLMALIGEQFDEADEICGVVASARSRGDKLSLWTRNAANEAVQMGIGRKWKEIIDTTDKINYSFHEDAKKDKSSRGRYNV